MTSQLHPIDRAGVDTTPGKIKRFLRRLYWFFMVYLGKPRVEEILTKNGLLRFWNKDKTTGRLLHVYRNHEFDEITRVHGALIKRGKLTANKNSMLDIGGYIGMSSTAFLLENFFERSYAFEPSPRNFKLLKENTSLNGLDHRLLSFNAALSDRSGTLEFELSDKNNGDNRIRSAEDFLSDAYEEGKRSLIQVPAYTLDDFLRNHPEIREDTIGLIWMDIQGHEPKFFLGAQNFFKRNTGTPVYMEMWPYGMKRSGADLEQFFLICETFFEECIPWGDSLRTDVFPISQLRSYYAELDKKRVEMRDPGCGANVLLL